MNAIDDALHPSLEDRYAADVFRLSYRRFLALKPTHYRWGRLAPQSVAYLEAARDQKWSMEKLSDFLHCPAPEAEASLRRYCVSKQVNQREGTAARLREAFRAWLEERGETVEKEKARLADELALIVANHLFASVSAREDPLRLSRELEGKEAARDDAEKRSGAADSQSIPPPPAEGKSWGPKWKD